MEEKILYITEAYSMQPKHISVITEESYKSYYKKGDACKEIKIELISIGNGSAGDAFMAYVGYNFEGKKIFQFKCDSCNVGYGEPY